MWLIELVIAFPAAAEFLTFCVIELIVFFLLTVNYRAIAKGKVGLTILTDVVIALLGFTVIKMVAEADGVAEMLGYVTGAGLGSWAGMTITKDKEKG